MGKEGKKKEKHWCEREVSVASQHAPWLGIKPVTFWCMEQRSHTGQGFLLFTQSLASLADSVFLVTSAASAVQLVSTGHVPFHTAKWRGTKFPRGTHIILWNQMFLISHISKENDDTMKHRDEALRSNLHVLRPFSELLGRHARADVPWRLWRTDGLLCGVFMHVKSNSRNS